MSSTAPTVVPTVSPVSSSPSSRIVSLDIFRGLIMVVMALDHTRDFFTNVSFEPETLAKTWTALFFTRWITHFCAPMFFLMGIAARLRNLHVFSGRVACG